MPSVNCPVCKKLVPIKWDAKERVWHYWPHGPQDKRCPGTGRLISSRVVP